MGYAIQRQIMEAGNNFNNALPANADGPVQPSAPAGQPLQVYDGLTEGGVFFFDMAKPFIIKRIMLNLGAATGWQLDMVSNGTVTTLYDRAGQGNSSVLTISGDNLGLLLPGDRLLLSSVGASTRITAEIVVSTWN